MNPAGRIEVRPSGLAEALAVLQRVPELDRDRPAAGYAHRLAAGASLVLVADRAGVPAGFKIGHALSPEAFYSWVGGVVPEARGAGAGRALLEAQERWVRAHGYARIVVKTAPRFAAMIGLLEAQGYLRVPAVAGLQAGAGDLVYAWALVQA